MKLFVTGATGFIGTEIVKELLSSGHKVLGLSRSEAGDRALRAAGAEVFRGDLEDLAGLQKAAASSEGVIHAGFIHDFARFKEVCEIDRKVVTALAAALEGSNRPLVVTSGTALVSPGKVATEQMASPIDSPHPRVASEQAAEAAAARGVHASLLRLSPSVHGETDRSGFVPLLINLAREKGFAAYIDEGKNRWTGVNVQDAARLFRLAAEMGPKGARYHAAENEGISFREITEAIGRGLKLPAVSITAQEAPAHFGWFAGFAGLDCPVSNKLTREQLGWQPKGTTLLEDLNAGFYFMR
jgi:nucleoside-diphosphate-sugar epimerase